MIEIVNKNKRCSISDRAKVSKDKHLARYIVSMKAGRIYSYEL